VSEGSTSLSETNRFAGPGAEELDERSTLTLASPAERPLRLAGDWQAQAQREPGGANQRWSRPRLVVPFAALAGGLGFPWVGGEFEQAISEGDPRAEVRLREAVDRRMLAAADMVAATLAVLLVVSLVAGQGLRPLALLALPLVVLTGKLSGLYDRDELLINRATLDEAPRLAQLATLYVFLFTVFQSVFVDGHLGPANEVLLWLAMFGGLVIARAGGRQLSHAVTPDERVLFVGTPASAERLRAKLAACDERTQLVAQMSITDLAPGDVSTAATVLGNLVDELRVHRVVIESSEAHPQATLDFVREAKAIGARVSLLPRVLEVVGSSIEIDDVHGLTLLGVRHFGLSRSSLAIKRGFDFLGAALGLLVLSPIFAVIAVLVKLGSPGPVFYRQVRIGREGRPFTMWKFRTMVDGAEAMKAPLRDRNEAEGLFKIADDPRITRIGRVLRHYSLDELPQLVNVLSAEMSLVGPRPLVPDEDDLITGLDRRRLQLTPGMTGRWQILGSARVPLPEMVKLDYLYVTGWSLWSDVKILLRTVPYVVARRGM
jgi:exopolysaccharide biosynthesis polyprenyl glycosylphosphotransferase